MLARCPACRTVFRVRSEQLRAHHGQVRCGNCLVPFDALSNLIEDTEPPAPLKAPEPPPDRADRFFVLEDKAADAFSDELDFELPEALVPQRATQRDGSLVRQEPEVRTPESPMFSLDPVADEPDATSTRSTTEQNPEPGTGERHTPVATPEHPGAEDAAPGASSVDDRSWRVSEEPGASEPAEGFAPDTLTRGASPRERKEPGLVTPPRTEEPSPPPEPAPGSAETPADADDEFADYAPPAPPPVRRGLTGLAIGLLSGMLAAQLLYLFRADVAREWPSLRPALVNACDALGCTVELPRIAGLISVESSDLQSEPGKAARFVLNATIRNRAPHPLAWPHLELTLTDARDRPLVRRALAPQEWFPGADLEQGFAAGRDIAVTLPFAADGLGATGYRIYAFYP